MLTAAGSKRVAGELTDAEATATYDRLAAEVAAEEVGALARIVAARLPHGPRIEFVEDVIRRTPLAAVELEAVLEEAVAAQKAELDARVEAARKRKEKEDAAEAALKRVAELFAERRRNRLDALRREFEIEGGKPSELREAKEAEPRPVVKPESTSAVSGTEDRGRKRLPPGLSRTSSPRPGATPATPVRTRAASTSKPRSGTFAA